MITRLSVERGMGSAAIELTETQVMSRCERLHVVLVRNVDVSQYQYR